MTDGHGWYYTVDKRGRAQGMGAIKLAFVGIAHYPRKPTPPDDGIAIIHIGPYDSFSEAKRHAAKAFTLQADVARGELAKVRDLRLMDIEK